MESLTRHTDYGHEGLADDQASTNPMDMFRVWLGDAEAADIFEPNAMVLSTIDPDGAPSSRTVLLKDLSADGFTFVTNYESRKAMALEVHPRVSALFAWYALKRQVIVSGECSRAGADLSDELWNRRPRGAQLASMASHQSSRVDSRAALEAALARLEKEHPEGTPVPRPVNWGAFTIRPISIELWAGRSMRFHDRHLYTIQSDGSWLRQRLQP